MVTIWICGQIVFQEEEKSVGGSRGGSMHRVCKELQGGHMTEAEFGKESDKAVKAER